MKVRGLLRLRPMGLVGVTLLLLAACNTPTPPTPPDTLDLQGLWLVEPGPGTDYGAGGTTTLEFGAGASGAAEFLSQADVNDITTCEQHVYAVVDDNVVLLADEYYTAEEVNANTIELTNDIDSMTLTRVAGAPPVEGCGEATLTQRGAYADSSSGFSSLSAFGNRLYLNVGVSGDPIISFDTTTDTFGALRSYTQSVMGGTHRMVVAARSDDVFFGHCACGGSTSVNAFNLATNTSIMAVETEDYGTEIGIRYGYFDDDRVTIGGRKRNTNDVNVLLTIHPDTLLLQDTREFLRGASIDDVTVSGGQLYALVNGDLVRVGNDGRAAETFTLDTTGEQINGLASIGSTLYVVANLADGTSGIYEVNLP